MSTGSVDFYGSCDADQPVRYFFEGRCMMLGVSRQRGHERRRGIWSLLSAMAAADAGMAVRLRHEIDTFCGVSAGSAHGGAGMW
jgi:hypothetical protein